MRRTVLFVEDSTMARFGVCTGAENLEALERAGYDYVELAVAGALKPEQLEDEVMPTLIEQFDRSSLKAEAYNVFLPGDLRVVGEGVDEVRQERYFQSAFARAARLGGQVVVFGSGAARRIPDGFSPETAQMQTVEFSRHAAEAAARQNLRVAVEPLNAGECNQILSVQEGTALVRAVDHPNFGVLSDLYHVTKGGQSFEETRDAGAFLTHVHIAGAQDRRAPVGEDQDYLTAFFRVLKEMGYAGRISVEGNWGDLPAQAAQTLDVLRRAWDAA